MWSSSVLWLSHWILNISFTLELCLGLDDGLRQCVQHGVVVVSAVASLQEGSGSSSQVGRGQDFLSAGSPPWVSSRCLLHTDDLMLFIFITVSDAACLVLW